MDPVVGINDILSKLYSQNQHIKDKNGSPAVSNGQDLNSNSDSNMHADLIDGDDGFDEDDDGNSRMPFLKILRYKWVKDY